MKLSEFKTILQENNSVEFVLPNGERVPSHYHITEVGQINKNFIDCGGTIRNEKKVSFQLYTANDFDHRLKAEKLLSIIRLSEEKLSLEDASIEVEYQGPTIGKYGLEFNGVDFELSGTQTDCLAKDNCGIPESKPKVKMSELNQKSACCSPSSGCC